MTKSQSYNPVGSNRNDMHKPKPKELPLVLESPPELQRESVSLFKFLVHDDLDIIAYQADHPGANLVRYGDPLVDFNDDVILNEEIRCRLQKYLDIY